MNGWREDDIFSAKACKSLHELPKLEVWEQGGHLRFSADYVSTTATDF